MGTRFLSSFSDAGISGQVLLPLETSHLGVGGCSEGGKWGGGGGGMRAPIWQAAIKAPQLSQEAGRTALHRWRN